MEQMLPQTVIDGIVKYVQKMVSQHVNITTNDQNVWKVLEPVVVNGESQLMMIFNWTTPYQYEMESSEEEE